MGKLSILTAEERRARKKARDYAASQTPESKAKRKAKRDIPEAKAKQKEREQSPKVKARVKEYRRTYKRTPKYKDWVKAQRGTPEAKAYRWAYDQTPRRKEKMKASNSSPEIKEKKRAWNQIPEVRSRRKAKSETPEAIAKRAKLRKKETLRLKNFLNGLYLKTGCIDCPDDSHFKFDLEVKNFHHVGQKTFNLSLGRSGCRGKTDEAILIEVAKCVCLCANHHMKRHAAIRREGASLQ